MPLIKTYGATYPIISTVIASGYEYPLPVPASTRAPTPPPINIFAKVDPSALEATIFVPINLSFRQVIDISPNDFLTVTLWGVTVVHSPLLFDSLQVEPLISAFSCKALIVTDWLLLETIVEHAENKTNHQSKAGARWPHCKKLKSKVSKLSVLSGPYPYKTCNAT